MFNPSISTQPATSFVSTQISVQAVNIPLPKIRVKLENIAKVQKTENAISDPNLEIIRNNDSLALTKLYNDFFVKVKTFIMKKGGRLEDAQDVFQEAFIIVVEKVRNNTLTLSCSLYSYLLRICRNIWFNKLKRKSNQCLGLEEELVVPQETGIYDDFNERIKDRLYQEKFALLPIDQQQVLSLYMDGYSMKEIAEEMGYASDKYAKKKKCLSQQALIKLVKADPIYRELTMI